MGSWKVLLRYYKVLTTTQKGSGDMSEQCQDYHREWGWFCTKEKGHGGRHRATIGLGEDAAVLGEWPDAPELSQSVKELVTSVEAVRRSGEWETLRWVLRRIEVQLDRAKADPQANAFSILRGLIVDIDKRMGVSGEQT